jgi:16S rRNA (guanine966-N2)-methyltransferase
MRIIAGEFRGRRFLPPENDATRPITDRVKQSLFDILAPGIAGAIVYDCFSGTGSLGLESLSREAKRVIFFESDPSAVAILRRNISDLGVGGRSRVATGDLFGSKFLHSEPEEKCNLVFLDPPYRYLTEQAADLKLFANLLLTRHLSAEGIVVFRHARDDSLDLAPLRRYDERSYGSMVIELLTCPSIPTNISPPPTPLE